MFITGPDVIKTVTGEEVEFEDLGGARAHNTKSGVAHYMGADEDDAIDYVKALLSYLPSNNMESVSYTHLDVYKRQAPTRALPSVPAPSPRR